MTILAPYLLVLILAGNRTDFPAAIETFPMATATQCEQMLPIIRAAALGRYGPPPYRDYQHQSVQAVCIATGTAP